MHRLFHALFLIFVFLSSMQTWSATGKAKPWGLSLDGGFSSISFSGVSGSDFSSFTHYQINFMLHHFRQKGWQWYGLGVAEIPGLNFRDVRWSNGAYGDYKGTFLNYYVFVGGAHKQFRWALLGGYETISWKGSPDAGASSSPYFNNGLLLGWDWKQKGKFNFPIYLRYWRKPYRKVSFTTYPDDLVNAKPGSEFDFSIGAHFGF